VAASSAVPLTVVVPTKNRPRSVSALLRFFRDCGLRHPIVVADTSDEGQALQVRSACKGIARYCSFDQALRLADKLAELLAPIETPFVAIAPDDDICMPHAIDAALKFLEHNPDYVAAHGYMLQFCFEGTDWDIHHVGGFTPSITEGDQLQRHYHLMRRYQPFYWAVFRTEVLVAAVKAARAMKGIVFRELTLMNTAILYGKIARLPLIYNFRGSEPSLTPPTENHPFRWFLHQSPSFFSGYGTYRDALAQSMRARAIAPRPGVQLEHLLDLIHATWLGREIDLGVLNHVTQCLLGGTLPPVHAQMEPRKHQPISHGDMVHNSKLRAPRRYIWRRAVTKAEPRNEITITAAEIDRIERQLDAYVLNDGGPDQ